MPSQMTEDERKQFCVHVAELYIAGRSIRQIAVATGRTYSTVRTALTVAGVTMRRRGSPTRPRIP